MAMLSAMTPKIDMSAASREVAQSREVHRVHPEYGAHAEYRTKHTREHRHDEARDVRGDEAQARDFAGPTRWRPLERKRHRERLSAAQPQPEDEGRSHDRRRMRQQREDGADTSGEQ